MSASSKHQEIRQLLENAIRNRIGSGMAAAWGRIGEQGQTSNEVYVGTLGHAGVAGRAMPAVGPQTFFDLASLTKVMATTAVAMVAFEKNRLRLDERLAQPGLNGITVGHLLSHTSGLPAWKPLYETLVNRFGSNLPYATMSERRDLFLSELMKVTPENKPGEKVVYSDIGFLHLLPLLESRFGQSLDQLARQWVWSAIPSSRLHYRPVRMDSAGERYRLQAHENSGGEQLMMTEACGWRGLLQGQVHDDNAWSLGGVATHAGVFGRLSDVVGYVHSLFNESWVSMSTVKQWLKEASECEGGRRAYGFDMVTLDGSGSTSRAFSPNSYGHLGFTGTSMWMDLDEGFFAVLLTNRVHPDRSDTRIRALRQAFHERVCSRA